MKKIIYGFLCGLSALAIFCLSYFPMDFLSIATLPTSDDGVLMKIEKRDYVNEFSYRSGEDKINIVKDGHLLFSLKIQNNIVNQVTFYDANCNDTTWILKNEGSVVSSGNVSD